MAITSLKWIPLALALWTIVGVLAGFLLAVLLDLDLQDTSFAIIFSIGGSLIIAHTILPKRAQSAKQVIRTSLTNTPSGDAIPKALSSEQARDWLDDFLQKQQE